MHLLQEIMSNLTLYDNPLSQNGYKARLGLSFLKVDYELKRVDLMKGEQKEEWYLKLNPNGQVPTLVDEDFAIWESNAILLYLGRKFTPNDLIPQDLQKLGIMLEWMLFESNKLSQYIGASRFLTKYMPPEKVNPKELERTRKKAHRVLNIFNNHLSNNEFVTGELSLADITCYGQICVAPEGEVELSEYSAVQDWMKKIEARPEYVNI